MSLRHILVDLVSTDQPADVSDEHILNVLRLNTSIAMGTQEIADAIEMSRQGAENRLSDLRLENRVRSEKIGGVLVWDLHPDERREPVPPEIDRLVHAFDYVRGLFNPTRRLGLYLLFTGFALIFTGLTSAITSTPADGMTDMLLVWGYGIAAGGGAAWAIGGGTQFVTVIVEHVVYWRLTGTSLSSWSATETAPTEQRGQLDVRFIFGVVILLLIGGALLSAASKLQAGLSASPAFSEFAAGLIALLFLLALGAAILGVE